MTQVSLPLERPYDLRDLGAAGAQIAIAPKGPELERLARWAGVEAIDTFEAAVMLRKLSAARFRLAIHLEAAIVQNCVVTLEPIHSRIVRDFVRELHLVTGPYRSRGDDGAVTLTPAEDDLPEEIESLTYDLAGPVLEEFSLAIDPYPRAPGVSFEGVEAPEPVPENPFAVLKALKER